MSDNNTKPAAPSAAPRGLAILPSAMNPATGEIIPVTMTLPPALASMGAADFGAALARAKDRAKLTAVEKDWTRPDGSKLSGLFVVAGRGEKAGPWERVILHEVNPETKVVSPYGVMRLCATVLWNEIAKGLASGTNVFYLEYLGRKASSGGGRSYHNFAVEALGTGIASTVATDEE